SPSNQRGPFSTSAPPFFVLISPQSLSRGIEILVRQVFLRPSSPRRVPAAHQTGTIMSSREDQVLERQRQMANRISQLRSGTGGGSSSARKPGKSKKPPPPPGPPPGGPPGQKARTFSGSNSSSNGGSNRSLASLAGVAPRASTSRTALGAGTAEDPIVLDDRKSPRQHRPQKSKIASGSDISQKSSPPVNTVAMALARARDRAGVKQSVPEATSSKAAATAKRSEGCDKPKSSQLKRPTMRWNAPSRASVSASLPPTPTAAKSPGTASGSLASILLSNSDTARYLQPNAPKLMKHYQKIEPDDYWKNIREWDFLKQMNEKTGDQKQRGGKGGGGNGSEVRQRKRSSSKTDDSANGGGDGVKQHSPLPDTFESYRQYCALWAPLCMEEARAQLLSGAIAEVPYWKRKPEKQPVSVRLKPLKKDVDGSSHNIGVRVDEVVTKNYKDRSFMANDIVLLMKKESYIWDASKGLLDRELDSTTCGIVGHIEYSRRSLEGLIIQVSRKFWTALKPSELVLLKLGCNITSLREFTALCRMDSIPLLDFILSGNIESKMPSQKLAGTATDLGLDPSADEKRAKKDVLSSMGGSSALGKGFSEWASHKFNLSQLGAISASAQEYGDGGFTLIKGPPGTGKTTTLCALLNALHIRQMNQYFGEVKKLAESFDAVVGKRASLSLSDAIKQRPRILVAAPSNAAVDNVILKIMADSFVDGNGCRYNPSIVRIGRGQSTSVKDVCLEEKVESYISESSDFSKLERTIEGYKAECRRIHADITKLRQRMNAIKSAAPYPLAKDWEIRIDEDTARVFFVNHKEKTTTYEVPPPPEPGQRHFPGHAMPEYKAFVTRVVKMVERYNSISTELERYSLCKDVSNAVQGGAKSRAMNTIRQDVETHILDSVHIVATTLGTAGNRSLEAANKFEVVVIDEAAQSVEPSTLAGLQLGSKHAILVGDPQQLPATIFNVSGRNTKYDRSLFARLEDAGHDVHLLNTQYRMHPAISDFPRRIFYDGKLMDGTNVKHPEYGNPLKRAVFRKFTAFQPFTVLDLESSEERGGTSLSNSAEAQFALHLFNNLKSGTNGLSTNSRVAVVSMIVNNFSLEGLCELIPPIHHLSYGPCIDYSLCPTGVSAASNVF
ncbi:hypothetical protein ACHAWF_011620, partial [Thalassiosira exigua]